MVDLMGPSSFRVLGIDPGTDTMGMACLVVDLEDHSVILEQVMTLQGHRNAKYTPSVTQTHGERIGRLYAHRQALARQFQHYRPHVVVSEAPFMGRFPAAYAALVECVVFIRFALFDYDPTMQLLMVDPPTAKMAVGVSGKSKDKNEVMEGIERLVAEGKLKNPHDIPIRELDEHSTDSIAVGWTQVQDILCCLTGETNELANVYSRKRKSKRRR